MRYTLRTGKQKPSDLVTVTCKGNTMRHSNHALHYIDMHPEPIKPEPSAARVIVWAIGFMLTLWVLVYLAFSI